MTNIKIKKEDSKLAERLSTKTHFNRQEIDILLSMHRVLADSLLENPRVDRPTFREFLHKTFAMTEDILLDRVFKVFDRDNDSFINQNEWVHGLDVFLKGTMEEQIQYCFQVYDLNADGYITREEMFHLLKTSLPKPQTEEDPDEGVKDLVETAIKKVTNDNNGRFQISEYMEAIKKEPLLLGSFGNCLPDEKKLNAFLEVIGGVPSSEGNFSNNNTNTYEYSMPSDQDTIRQIMA